MQIRFPLALSLGAVFTLVACSPMIPAQQPSPIHGDNGIILPSPPVAAVQVVTDDYSGTKIEDPYRWLEDAKSPQTRAWIAEENAYTQKYLDQLKDLPQVERGLAALMRVETYSMPVLRGGKYFFNKQLPDENQGSIYVRDGWNGTDRRLIDATKLSADQNTNVGMRDISDDGNLLVYEVRQGGADEGSIHILNVRTGEEMPDVLPPARYFGVGLSPGNTGLYYAKFTHQGSAVWFHKFGTPVGSDQKIFGGEYRGQHLGELDLVSAHVSDNHHWLVIGIGHGVPATSQDILLRDLRRPDSSLVPLVVGVKAHVRMIDAGDRFFLLTDDQAPNGRIVEAFPGKDPSAWKTIIPQGKDVIDSFSIVGGKMFVSRLHDVKTDTTIYSLDGKQVGTLPYPGIGTGTVVYGRPGQTEGFYSFQSFTIPPTIYRYDTRTGQSTVFARPRVPFDSSQYEVRQVFYTSKDGTRVPMFIAGKKGLQRNGQARLLMTGYGAVSYTHLTLPTN